MNILAIESSCDETAAAVVKDGRQVLSDMLVSQIDMHKVYGGVVPEIASRRHLELISQLADKAVADSGCTRADLDAVAVTYAPGLIGALLVGVNFAKSVSAALGIPLIPVHHIRGHIASNYIAFPELEPPFIALVVSGGHSLIVDVKTYTDMKILGSTRDDAAGECFDKVARAMGLDYPGGLAIDRLSKGGRADMYKLPRSKIEGSPLDMSFSGLKTAVINLLHKAEQRGEELDKESLAASFSQAVSDTLVPRAMLALKQSGYSCLAMSGGVAANSKIRSNLEAAMAEYGGQLFVPPLSLCGDNAMMIGAQAYYEFSSGNTAGLSLNAYATMGVDKVRY